VAVDHRDVMSVGVGVDSGVDRNTFVFHHGTAPFVVSAAPVVSQAGRHVE